MDRAICSADHDRFALGEELAPIPFSSGGRTPSGFTFGDYADNYGLEVPRSDGRVGCGVIMPRERRVC